MPRSIFSIGPIPNVTVDMLYTNPDKVVKAEKLIKAMPEIEMRAYHRACINFGRLLSRYVRACIRSNTPPSGVSWPPHSKQYLKHYNVKGFWQLSGQMLRSIRVRNYQNTYFVGPNPNEKARDPVNKYGRSRESNLTLIQLARLLELGESSDGGDSSLFHSAIPARPLFRPSFKAVGGTARLKKYLITNLRRELKPYI